MKHLVVIAAAIVFGSFVWASPAMAKEPTFGVRRNLLDPFVTVWKSEGPAGKMEDGRLIIREYEAARPCWRGACKTAQGSFTATVPISERSQEKIALIISYTRAEEVRANDETGLPVIVGTLTDISGKTIGVMQSSALVHPTTHKESWAIVSGSFPILVGTEDLLIELGQANRRGTPADGRAAEFFAPGLFILSQKSDIEPILRAYTENLPKDRHLPEAPVI